MRNKLMRYLKEEAMLCETWDYVEWKHAWADWDDEEEESEIREDWDD